MKIQRSLDTLHPILAECVKKIQKDVIDQHNIPIRLFETGRSLERHKMLISKGRTKDCISGHLYNLENDPPLYTRAVDYVFYDGRWSWNLRDSTVTSWYNIFGNLVLDICPELEWSYMNRKAQNVNHFILKSYIIEKNLNKYPCVLS
jgi:hypothetical protein